MAVVGETACGGAGVAEVDCSVVDEVSELVGVEDVEFGLELELEVELELVFCAVVVVRLRLKYVKSNHGDISISKRISLRASYSRACSSSGQTPSVHGSTVQQPRKLPLAQT